MTEEKVSPWKTLGRKVVYRSPYILLREDSVILPDGSEGTYGVLVIPHVVGTVVLNEKSEIYLVGQWRYPVDHFSWLLPGGRMEEGEIPLEAAKRELKEETGIIAGKWLSFGSVDGCDGHTTEICHLFAATDLQFGDSNPEPSEKIEGKWFPFDTAVQMAIGSGINNVNSVAGILKAKILLFL